MKKIYFASIIILVHYSCFGIENQYLKITTKGSAISLDKQDTLFVFPNEIYKGFLKVKNQNKNNQDGFVIQLDGKEFLYTQINNQTKYITLKKTDILNDSVKFESVKRNYISKKKKAGNTFFVFNFNNFEGFNEDTIYIRKINGDLLAKIPSNSKKSEVPEFTPQTLRIHVQNLPTIIHKPDWKNIKFDLSGLHIFTTSDGITYYFDNGSKSLYTIDSKNELAFKRIVCDTTRFLTLKKDSDIVFKDGNMSISKIEKSSVGLLILFLLIGLILLLGTGVIFWIDKSGQYQIKTGATLNKISEVTSINVSFLTYLNKGILSGLEPDQDLSKYESIRTIRIPRRFQRFIKYKVENNDTLKTIAEKFNITEEAINESNAKRKNFQSFMESGVISEILYIRLPLHKRDETELSEDSRMVDYAGLSGIEKEKVPENTSLILKSISELRGKIDEINDYKQRFQTTMEQLECEKKNSAFLEKELIKLRDKNNSTQNEVNALNKLIYRFPHNEEFEQFIDRNKSVFDFISSTENILFMKLLNKIRETGDYNEQIAFSQIAEKYLTHKPAGKFESWQSFLKSKFIADEELINLVRLKPENEHIKLFKSKLYDDVYQDALSGLFILLSELSLFPQITGTNSQLADEVKSRSLERLQELNTITKQNIKYFATLIELFSDWRNYKYNIEMDANRPCSPYLKKLKLPDNTIREIIQVGFEVKDPEIISNISVKTKFKNA